MNNFIVEFMAKRKEYKAWMLGPDKWDKRSMFHPMELAMGMRLYSPDYYRNKALRGALKGGTINTLIDGLGNDFGGLLPCLPKK